MSEHPANLLIVEDEPITRNQLTSHFDKEGYAVTGSANADAVLERTTMLVIGTITRWQKRSFERM
ncbi:MAG: hypothetical protein ACNYPE_07730 [Candidatus Azotimanducaceae bacterium WSBS_2022_MAG_OTU7]